MERVEWVERAQRVEMVQREVANLEIQIEELDEEKLFLSCALAAKEKESEQAWEEVIMAVAERLARSEATSLDPAPSPISSIIECHTSRARSARAKPSTAACLLPCVASRDNRLLHTCITHIH